MKQIKDEKLQIKLSKPFKARLFMAAQLTDLSAATLIRDSVNEKLNRLSHKYPELNQANFAGTTGKESAPKVRRVRPNGKAQTA
jgi:hypothetical protein